jgi:hypothetical protein
MKLFRNFLNALFVPSLKSIYILKFMNMKKFVIIIMLTAIITQGFCMQVSSDDREGEKNRDTSVNLKIGNRGVDILESLEGHMFNYEMYPENNKRYQEDQESDHHHRVKRFRGHWAGLEFGFNNYLTSDNSLTMPDDIEYMTLHSGKSKNFSLNFSQLSLGLARHIGFVTGLGINWNNYKFDGDNNIQKGTNGIIEVLYPETILEKSKLTTIYLTLPFILEMQIPVNNNHINIAGGAIGALKLGSHTKMVYEDDRRTVRSNGDFSLNMLRYGATARIGYENFHFYGTYYMTPLFRNGMGPGGYDLYPIEIGVAFTINN